MESYLKADINRRKFIVGTAALTASYGFLGDKVSNNAERKVNEIQESKEVLENENPFFGNEYIGLQMSDLLPGIIDLKYFNEETEEWHLYNNIVPEIRVDGVLNNAEMFSTETRIEHFLDDDGTQHILIEYEKMPEGTVDIGGNIFDGQGAHFDVVATIRPGEKEITFQIFALEDSAEIESASLTNFLGAANTVRYLRSTEQLVDILDESKYPSPNDGNFKIGNFIDLEAPSNGTVFFWGEGDNIVQYQRLGDGFDTDSTKLKIEKRTHPWRPEHNDPNHPLHPKRPWLEMVRLEQKYTPNCQWTFGYIEESRLQEAGTLSY